MHIQNPSNAHQLALVKASKHMENFRLWSEQELKESMCNTLEKAPFPEEIWVFAYGSLIWKPEFPFVEERDAKLLGYQRSLCLWSCVNRGTPEQPGLVFALEPGDYCLGRAFRLATDKVIELFTALWRREMNSGDYLPLWVDCHTDKGPIKALAFILDCASYGYAKDLSIEDIVEIVIHAHGQCGPCSEYVINTAKALKKANIDDQKLFDLVDLIELRLASL